MYEFAATYPRDTGAHHHCEIITTDGRTNMTPYVMQVFLLGSTVFFTVLLIGIVLVIDRARATPTIRARLQEPSQARSRTTAAEEMLTKALKTYKALNSGHNV